MSSIRLLVMSGSSRTGSFNRRLAALAASIAQEKSAQVEMLDLRSLELPVYDGDLEAASGVPAGAHRLRDAIIASDALFVVTPEYNGFPPPLLINAFDWLSRLREGAGLPSGLAATANKPVGLASASPGALGGLRSMNYVRQYLQMAFAMLVAPQQLAVARAGDAFDAEGGLKDAGQRAVLEGNVHALLRLATALNAG